MIIIEKTGFYISNYITGSDHKGAGRLLRSF